MLFHTLSLSNLFVRSPNHIYQVYRLNSMKWILALAHAGFKTRMHTVVWWLYWRIFRLLWSRVQERASGTFVLVISSSCYWLLDLIVVLRLCFDRGMMTLFLTLSHNHHELIHTHHLIHRDGSLERKKFTRFESFSANTSYCLAVQLTCIVLLRSIECARVRVCLPIFVILSQWHSHYVD